MKKSTPTFLKSAFAILMVLMAIISCKKDTTTATTGTSTKFTFKLDGGAATTVDSATATLYSTKAGRQMDVYAFKGGAEILEFHFDPKAGSKTVGTGLGSSAFLTYMESPVKSYDSQSGTFTLTTCDTIGKKIEGDFSFVAKQYPYTATTVKTITEGHLLVTKISK